MTVVKELNELAKKMTGVNPGARTDAQALNYIEQNYNGESGDVKTYEINPMLDNYEDPSLVTITDTEAVSKLKEVYDLLKNGVIPIVSLYANYFTETLVKYRFYSNKMFLYFEHYMLKSNDGNTFQIMYMAPTPTPTPQSKFDYIIPEISFDSYDETTTISNSEIISVLDEIQANSLDGNNNIVDLRIGAYLHDTDSGGKSFSSMVSCNEIGVKGVNNYQFIMFINGSSPRLLTFSYNDTNNKWFLYNTTLSVD